jgi:glycerate kinase
MRILIAPDGFKESMSAGIAAEAMARGARRACAAAGVACEVDICPIADGGEGTVDAFAAATGASTRTSDVTGPLGETLTARWALHDTPRTLLEAIGDTLRRVMTPVTLVSSWLFGVWIMLLTSPARRTGRIAVVETASAAGLMLVPEDRRDPTQTSTVGLGQLIRAAVDARASEVIVGLGSSATCDGGIGVASAYGYAFYDKDGARLPPIGASLGRIAHITTPRRVKDLRGIRVIAMCDVDNPLTGPNGAAHVYGPQKGASSEQVEALDAGLANLAARCAAAGLTCDPDAPGSGAAGGLGFGLRTFLGADLRRGFDVVAGVTDLHRRVASADLVLTGEGRLDEQTLRGKAVFGIASLAAKSATPVVAIVGCTDVAPERAGRRLEQAGAPLIRVLTLEAPAGGGEAAMADAVAHAEATAAEAVGTWLEGEHRSGYPPVL